MVSIIFAIFGLLTIILLWQRQRPAFIAGFIVIFSLAYRIVDITYLDLVGPIYAIELERHVGGNGAAPIFVVATLCFIVPLWIIVSRQRILAGIEDVIPPSAYLDGLQRAAFIGCSAYIAFLYLDMLRIGVIPLFAGIDRLEYQLVSGIVHNLAYEMNFLVSAVIGIFTVLPRLRGKRLSLPFIALLMAFLIYWALTGNRFSAFLITLSYFALPFGALVAMQAKGILRRESVRGTWSSLLSSRIFMFFGFITVVISVTALMFNSYYTVRNYADPTFHLSQRVLVQPVQTWSSTWEMVRYDFDRGINHTALDLVLLNPPNPDSNTTIQYLMERELGYFRAMELINAGQQYAGGYPEIFFELFGFWLAIPLMILLGSAAAFLLYIALRSVAQGRALTAAMAVYLYYGFGVAYIGGMLNFLLAPTFALKLVALLIFFFVERRLVRAERAPSAFVPPFQGIASAGHLPAIHSRDDVGGRS
ncbi:DUF6418 domain-containing protein [Qipengyuania sp. DY56-A-20]|uniref:DUF6418 domain-containing protein n=1 Tax=Qipengyuania benthica TaxID=3067651 RepID=A0ABT9HB64_9SPHN|nr:DUF6418 domain-containing protein [Qipengyuania sp. DY56-A-20]MDP4540574.1 DUF6418 domain-containing protein [Qipengyuania sp. DY56-A-20]